MRWWFCLPVNPAYVLAGLLIAFVLVCAWELTGDDPSPDARSAASPPAPGPREWGNQAFVRALAVLVALVGGFLLYVAPEIALNKIWPDEPAQWAGPCVPSVRSPRAGDGPRERARLEAVAAIEEHVARSGRPGLPALTGAIYDTGVRMTHMPSPSAASTSSGRCTVTTAR